MIATDSKVSDRQWFVEGWHLAFRGREGPQLCDLLEEGERPDRFATAAGDRCRRSGGGQRDRELRRGQRSPGGGARMVGSTTDWQLNATFPVDDGTDADTETDNGWRTFAHHRAGSSSNTMLVDVFCFAGGPVEYVVKDVSSDRSSQKVVAKCPKDSVAIGGGCFVSRQHDSARCRRDGSVRLEGQGQGPRGWLEGDDCERRCPDGFAFKSIAVCL